MLKLGKKHLFEIKRILAAIAPDCEARVFGSRVNGRAGKYSDVDIALIGRKKMNWREVEKIKDAFSASDLPFMVDVLDWHDIPGRVRETIESLYEVIQKPRAAKTTEN